MFTEEEKHNTLLTHNILKFLLWHNAKYKSLTLNQGPIGITTVGRSANYIYVFF